MDNWKVSQPDVSTPIQGSSSVVIICKACNVIFVINGDGGSGKNNEGRREKQKTAGVGV